MREFIRANFSKRDEDHESRKRLMSSFGTQKRAETIEKIIEQEKIDEQKGMI